jgi:hypothetical protein
MVENQNTLDFEYDFGGVKRTGLLTEAAQAVRALESNLGPDTPPSDAAEAPALALLNQLNQEIAEFSAYPEVLQLREEHFTEHDLAVPTRFRDLSQNNKFYWLRFPITLFPLQNFPFYKLECKVEFNPGISEGHLRPRTQQILPNRKFLQLLEFTDNLELRIGEDFEFTANSGSLEGQVGPVKATTTAAVDAKTAGSLGFVAGPFTYRLKRAQIEHSPTGTEQVFWRLAGAEFFQEDDPTFIVVLQVPKSVNEVRIAAALQAYHKPNIAAMGLGEFIGYFGSRLAAFFRQGAPATDTKIWDITPDITPSS